ncbi:MAG: ribonuclease P protein component [Bacteroidaceae bacterium]|nr:ribonuclease P protein component [Bacteroidaceae bacterium]
MSGPHTFPKSSRLCSRKAIESLFGGNSRSLAAYPLRVVFEPSTDNTQVLFSVSKRHFKHAVDRNRAKRQLREAWRLHRDILSEAADAPFPPLHIAFLWMADEPQPTDLIHRKVKNLLHRIREQLAD